MSVIISIRKLKKKHCIPPARPTTNQMKAIPIVPGAADSRPAKPHAKIEMTPITVKKVDQPDRLVIIGSRSTDPR
jgi:hypothetical protein